MAILKQNQRIKERAVKAVIVSSLLILVYNCFRKQKLLI